MKRLLFAWVATLFCLAAMGQGSPYSWPDGLPRSTPEAQGVRSEAIADFFRALDEGGYEVHGIMILRHDQVIAEHWWYPYAPQFKHAMYSNTKTWTATAIGFAVQEGLLKVSDRVVDFFPDLAPAHPAPELASLTVEHLLTMSAGHRSTYYEGSGDDQVRAFLAMDYAHAPGTSFAYNITCSHMLSQIITRVTGETIYEYLRPRLFEPLGLSEDIVWEMDLSGRNMGNGGMHARTSDLAKFGTFLKNKGRWGGRQLLDPAWIEAMTTPHIWQNPDRDPAINAKDDGSQGYGYQTWMGRHGSWRAIGASNQLTLVVPDCDVVVAVHASIGDENGFNSLVYQLCDTMSDKKLKPAKGFDLNAALAGYALKMPFAPGDPAATVRSCTRRYALHQNDWGIRTVDFRFDKEGNVYLTLEADAFTTNLPFGLDGWKYGATDRKPAFGRMVYANRMAVTPYETAGSCSWTGPGELSTYCLSMFNVGADETFRFRFGEDGSLSWTLVAPKGRGGAASAADITLTGTLIRTTERTTPF